MATTSAFSLSGGAGTDGCSETRYRSPFLDTPSDSAASTPQAETNENSNASTPQAGTEGSNLKTCRICFETTTESYDPELGRLLSPCRCRGSSKYVHEQCLNSWRTLSANSRSYYECNTCGYKYKLRRLKFGNWIGSRALQFSLTITIILLAIFLLGFVADPIINAYLASPAFPSPPPSLRPRTPGTAIPPIPGVASEPVPGTLVEHMLKGLTSLGLLGFVKVIFFVGPQSWFNLRNTGIFGGGRRGRTGGTGRERLGELAWLVILIGLANFFVWVWQVTSGITRRWLDKAMEEIMDVDEDEAKAD
ncbi:hypothetical protein BDZ91DRAFT_655826 [Kalaharituber pfeilii]|nr:hypothetical protein BDZ91DRAFT_655826 [Kalaharituber pfeilii]